MFFLYNLQSENAVPVVIAAGKVGGTVIVIKSIDLKIINFNLYP